MLKKYSEDETRDFEDKVFERTVAYSVEMDIAIGKYVQAARARRKAVGFPTMRPQTMFRLHPHPSLLSVMAEIDSALRIFLVSEFEDGGISFEVERRDADSVGKILASRGITLYGRTDLDRLESVVRSQPKYKRKRRAKL